MNQRVLWMTCSSMRHPADRPDLPTGLAPLAGALPLLGGTEFQRKKIAPDGAQWPRLLVCGRPRNARKFHVNGRAMMRACPRQRMPKGGGSPLGILMGRGAGFGESGECNVMTLHKLVHFVASLITLPRIRPHRRRNVLAAAIDRHRNHRLLGASCGEFVVELVDEGAGGPGGAVG